MPRNFRRRVELMFPDRRSRGSGRRIVDRILAVVLSDNLKARELQSDGTYRRLKPKPGEPVIRSQTEFQNIARRARRGRPDSPGRAFRPGNALNDPSPVGCVNRSADSPFRGGHSARDRRG